MSESVVYLGYNLHWGLYFLRGRLAVHMLTAWLFKSDEARKGGFLHPESQMKTKITELVDNMYADYGKYKMWMPESFNPMVDTIFDLEKVFIGSILSTGVQSVIYHGNDEHTPNNITLAKGKELVGNGFQSVEKRVLEEAKEEIHELFPYFGKITSNILQEDLGKPEWRDFQMLIATLIDILVSLRTNSRILLFNPKSLFDSGIRQLPASSYKDLQAFYSLFEDGTTKIIMPTTSEYGVMGLRNDLFGSTQFIEYCRSHDLLNFAYSDYHSSLGKIERSVVKISENFDKQIEESTMKFAILKSAEKAVGLMTAGISGYMKEFVGVIVRLCKERERRLSLYSGNNLEEFATRLVERRLLGSV